MYHTYTICSLAEERSRGRVLDPISMGSGFEPHLKHCVVFLNMTLNILCSLLIPPPPPMKSEGYCFGVGRLCTRLSVCLSTCPSRNIPKYLLVRFGAFSAWMDSTMGSPKCGSRGGAGCPDLPQKITSYIFSLGISNWNPPPRKKLDPPPTPWKMLDPLGNLEKW